MKAKNKKKRIINKTAKITYLIFLIASLIFIFLLNMILPKKYIIALVVFFSILLVIFGFFALITKVKNKFKIIQICCCFLLSVLLVLCDVAIPFYSGKISRLFVKIPDEGQMNINVYTLTDKNYTDIEQLAGKKIGIQTKVDIDYQNYAIKVINKEIQGEDIQIANYQDIYQLVETLYSGEVEAILLNQNYASIIADNKDFADFNSKCVSVYTVTQKVELIDSTTSVSNIVNQPFLIAVSGNDQWDYNSITASSNYRTDVNMLVGINPQSKQILILTLPRDSYVYLDGMGYDKLTHASIYGNSCWVNAIKRILSLDEINYYFKVNFQSVSDIVDALGGIEVDNPYYFESSYCLRYDEDLKKVVTETRAYPEGIITLDGSSALGYVRERYTLPEGDISRNKHQAIFLKGCINKLCSVSTITNISAILTELQGTFTTDISFNEILSLAQMQLDDMADWNIKSYSILGYGDYRQCFSLDDGLYSVEILYDESLDLAKEYIKQLYNGEILQ
ncbi:MAG: LCP family protein [Erysipelotrichaceae bacterium]